VANQWEAWGISKEEWLAAEDRIIEEAFERNPELRGWIIRKHINDILRGKFAQPKPSNQVHSRR